MWEFAPKTGGKYRGPDNFFLRKSTKILEIENLLTKIEIIDVGKQNIPTSQHTKRILEVKCAKLDWKVYLARARSWIHRNSVWLHTHINLLSWYIFFVLHFFLSPCKCVRVKLFMLFFAFSDRKYYCSNAVQSKHPQTHASSLSIYSHIKFAV